MNRSLAEFVTAAMFCSRAAHATTIQKMTTARRKAFGFNKHLEGEKGLARAEDVPDSKPKRKCPAFPIIGSQGLDDMRRSSHTRRERSLRSAPRDPWNAESELPYDDLSVATIIRCLRIRLAHKHQTKRCPDPASPNFVDAISHGICTGQPAAR